MSNAQDCLDDISGALKQVAGKYQTPEFNGAVVMFVAILIRSHGEILGNTQAAFGEFVMHLTAALEHLEDQGLNENQMK